jgi:DNA mismatch repair ATPase MutS
MLTSNSIDQHKIGYYRTRVIRLDNGQQSNDPSNSKNLNLIIDHKLEPGISERSYALEVAQMAGFPKQALKNAKAALESII